MLNLNETNIEIGEFLMHFDLQKKKRAKKIRIIYYKSKIQFFVCFNQIFAMQENFQLKDFMLFMRRGS